jgi:pimeloyl-ACP methyl ester carboxylesterase
MKKLFISFLFLSIIIGAVFLTLLHKIKNTSYEMNNTNIQNKTINVNGIKIYTETFGNQKNEAIILISGAMGSIKYWPDFFCTKLADNGYFVIRFDNRDMGYSTHFPPNKPDSNNPLPYSIYDMVEDVYGVLKYYEKDQSHIIGHSLGGSIAQLFATKYPEKTITLIPISSPILSKGSMEFIETDKKVLDEMWTILMSNKMYPDFKRGKEEFLKIWKHLHGNWPIDENMANEYTKHIYETEKIEPAWNHINIQKNIPDIIEDLRNFQKPILFIYGEKDYLAANPENVKLLANHLEKANLYIIPDAGHLFFNHKLWDLIYQKITKTIEKCKVQK